MALPLEISWSILAVLFLIVMSVGIGEVVWRKLFHNKSAATYPINYFIGQVFLSLLFTILSYSVKYPFNFASLVLVLSPFIVIGVKGTIYAIIQKKQARNKRSLANEYIGKNPPWFYIIFRSITFLLLGIHILSSFAPITGWDELAYHVPVIKEIAAGDLSFPFLKESNYINFYTAFPSLYGNFPYGSEAYAAAGYAIGQKESTVNLIYMVNFIFFLAFVDYLLKKLFLLEKGGRSFVILAFFLSTNFVTLLSIPLIDVNVAIYQFISLAILFLAMKEKKFNLISASMLFMGYSLGMKYTALYFVPLYIILLTYEFYITPNLHKRYAEIIRGCFFAFVGGGFWYIKNLLVYKNPIYPFLFGHNGMAENHYQLIVNTQLNSQMPKTTETLLILIKDNYLSDPVFIVSTILITLVLVSNRNKNRYKIYFIISGIYLFLFNFYIGNQLVRYVLFTPLVFIFLSGESLKGRNWLTMIAGFSLILYLVSNTNYRYIWVSKIKDIGLIFKGQQEQYLQNRVGCLIDMSNFIKTEDRNFSRTVNLWDSYASFFYPENTNYLYYKDLNANDMTIKPKYLYINEGYKKQFLSSPNYHIDLDLKGMEELEENFIINKKPIFAKEGCILYRLI